MAHIRRILGQVLRWVLGSSCVACEKESSDLAPACVHCDPLMGTQGRDVSPKR